MQYSILPTPAHTLARDVQDALCECCWTTDNSDIMLRLSKAGCYFVCEGTPLMASDTEGNPARLIDPASVRPSINRGPSGPGWVVVALVVMFGGGVMRDVVMEIKLIGRDA
ncbi:hypothetical protein INR49_015489 [Caranx melampygus]|nr:hypothetical protein INR49_015489 [Caranx melampygus]